MNSIQILISEIWDRFVQVLTWVPHSICYIHTILNGQASFTKSTLSLAYPYVSASEENEPLQSSLVSEFAETCGNDAGLSKLAIVESCAANGGNFEKLTDINSVHVIVLVLLENISCTSFGI